MPGTRYPIPDPRIRDPDPLVSGALLFETPMNASPSFDDAVVQATGGPLRAASIQTVQVNIGLACNLACLHCHVESGPKRTEAMSRDTMEQVLDAVRATGAAVVDITGGAPEMHPHFRWFVDEALAIGVRVMVRTNLTILLEAGHTDLPAWWAARRVHLVASLPCYTQDNVDAQRGLGTFDASIEALRQLNAVGYGLDARASAGPRVQPWRGRPARRPGLAGG